MKIQDHINSTDLDMTEIQVRAFFLGVLCAEKPLPYHKALTELLSETPEAKQALEVPLKSVWDELHKNLKSELNKMFPDESDTRSFVELAKDQLDFFLTAMTLSGTNADNCDDEELGEFINMLEELVEDMEDFLADSEASEKDGEDFREFLLDNWKSFANSRQ